MALLLTAAAPVYRIGNLPDYLQVLSEWHAPDSAEGYLSQLWYRGVNDITFPDQRPGVYRARFESRAGKLKVDKAKDFEDKRLHLERELLSQFRTSRAVFLRGYEEVEIYFAAQHHRMPTRLLDWSTNPLAALFFACDGPKGKDGVVYAMDARQVIQPGASQGGGDPLYPAIMTMRHPYVRYAIGLSFWSQPKPDHEPNILPVRPDVARGRIGQQSSAFTLHMHRASDVTSSTLIASSVEAGAKPRLLTDLHRLNINQFTTYYDLDHLSQEITQRWGVA